MLKDIRTNKNNQNNNIRDHTLRHRVAEVVPMLGTIITLNVTCKIRTVRLRKETSLLLVRVATNSQVHLQQGGDLAEGQNVILVENLDTLQPTSHNVQFTIQVLGQQHLSLQLKMQVELTEYLQLWTTIRQIIREPWLRLQDLSQVHLYRSCSIQMLQTLLFHHPQFLNVS